MKRLLVILSLCFASLGAVQASNPSEEWKAYRIARITSNGKSSQEKVKIWSDYLAKYPNGPYRERALEELDAASRGAWQPLPAQTTTPDCAPGVPFLEIDAVLGVDSSPVATPVVAPVAPALTPPDRLKVPGSAANKRPAFAGLRSVGLTYAGLIAGSLILESGDSEELGIALMATSAIVGPSMGHLYAGDKTHAKKMITARAVAAGALALGAYQMSNSVSNCDFECNSSNDGLGLIITGATVGYALIIYDLVDSFFTVQRMQGRPVLSRMRSGYTPAYRY
jgi:hypothetical protein